MSTTALAEPQPEPTGDLFPADRTVGLRSYLRALYERADFIRYVAASELRRQQMTTVLGNLWHLVNPALQIGVYYLIFGVVLAVDRGVDNFVAFLSVGLFVFQYSQRTTMAGARSIASNVRLIRSMWFPRAMLPLTSTITELFSFLPALAVMFGVCLVTGESPRLEWLLVPGLVVLQTLFNFGLALVAARATSIVRDVQEILPYVFRLALYASGVLFLVDEYVTESRYRLLFELNPFYAFITIYRWAVLGYELRPTLVVVALSMTAGFLVVGMWWFRRGERDFGDA